MEDLTSLNITSNPETVEPESYVPAYDVINTDPIDKGTYTVTLVDGKFKDEEKRRPIRIGTMTSKKNGESYASCEVALDVEAAKVNGKEFSNKRTWARVNRIPEGLMFQNVKPGREKANSWADMLFAAGHKGTLQSDDDYVSATLELIEQGAVARARIDKSAYCNPKSNEYPGCGASIRGEVEFTGIENEDGETVDVGLRTYCPGEHSEDTRPVLLAKNEVKAFYPARNQG